MKSNTFYQFLKVMITVPFLLFCYQCSFAQTEELPPISADRPGMATSADFGFAWLILDNLQFDASANIDLRHLRKYYMIGAGLSWHI
jgi:hypothetical protein